MNFLITKGIEVQDQVCAAAQLVGSVFAPLLTLPFLPLLALLRLCGRRLPSSSLAVSA